jgi:ubiquinone/menaquinone biosynthesis C-methylase UbiE
MATRLSSLTTRPGCATADNWRQVYMRWRASRIGALTDQLERGLILEMLRDVADRAVLDVGCGDGDLALGEHHAQVSGIDASQGMIDAARARAQARSANIDFELARAEQIPFPDDRFDIGPTITILCFVADASGVFP